jgi:chromosome segregation ATPase
MTNKIETLQSEIADLVEQLNAKKQERALNLAALEVKKQEMDDYEIDPDSLEERYKDFLNEMEEMPNGWDYSDVLERMDPIMYRCGLNDYADSFDKEEFQDYKELQEEFEEFDNINDQLNDEIFDLESEIEDLESELQDSENE